MLEVPHSAGRMSPQGPFYWCRGNGRSTLALRSSSPALSTSSQEVRDRRKSLNSLGLVDSHTVIPLALCTGHRPRAHVRARAVCPCLRRRERLAYCWLLRWSPRSRQRVPASDMGCCRQSHHNPHASSQPIPKLTIARRVRLLPCCAGRRYWRMPWRGVCITCLSIVSANRRSIMDGRHATVYWLTGTTCDGNGGAFLCNSCYCAVTSLIAAVSTVRVDRVREG